MSKVYSLKELMDMNLVTANAELVSNDNSNFISYEEYKDLFENGGSVEGKYPVIPDSVWIAQSKDGYVFSCDKQERYSKFSEKFGTFAIRKIVKDEKEEDKKLSSVLYLTFNGKDELEMEKDFNIDELLGQVEADMGDIPDSVTAPNAEDVQNMNAFGDAPAVVADSAKDAITEAITANISGVHLANANDLGFFCQKYGRLVAYITQNEPVIKFGVSSKPRKDAEGNKILLSDVPDEIRTAFNNGDSRISSTYFEKDYSLNIKQAAPGKILGGVISIPKGGDIDIIELKGEGDVKFDKNDKDLVYKMLSKDELNLLIATYYNGTIKEDSATFGDYATKVDLQAKAYNKAGRDGEIVKLIKHKLVPNGRNKVIVPGSFFPVKTYETIDQASALTPEQCDILNTGSFINLFTAKENAVPKALELNDIDRQKIKEENGKITSVFFTTNIEEKEQLEITPYWMKNGEDLLSVVEVPVKVAQPKKNGTGVRYLYKTYSSLAKEVAESAEYKNKTSLYGGKYDNVLQACHGAITEESLRKLTARKKTAGSKKDGTLDLETTRKLLLMNSESGLSGLEIEGGKRITIEDFRESMGQA